MQEAQSEREELLGELCGKTVTTTLKEIDPMGVKFERNSVGQFSGKKYNASHVETLAMFLNPYDGTLEWDSKALETTDEGDIIAIYGKGTGRRSSGAGTMSIEGEVTLRSRSQKFSWLNTAKMRVEGTFNDINQEINQKLYFLM